MEKYYIIKLVTIILIISTLISYIPTISKASSIIGDTLSQGKDFIETQPDGNVKVNDTEIIDTSKQIYKTLMIIGIVVAAIIITVLGIQFMTGSVEQKVKVKEMLVPFGVGCLVIFGSLTIWRIVISIMSSIV